MNDYTTVFSIKDVTVYDNNKVYQMNITRELVETPDVLKPVASAVYRIHDEIFGDRYNVELKPEYKGIIKRFDRNMTESQLNHAGLRYDVNRLLMLAHE